MTITQPPLYDSNAADALHEREKARKRKDAEKFALLDEHIPACRRLVDIGCGWGQLLARVQGRVAELWGVDESPDRVRDVHEACPTAKVVVCRAEVLDLPTDHFDIAVTSQMLHEVKLFGAEGELHRTLCEIRRVLVAGGRYLLLDHADAGDGEVVVRLPDKMLDTLAEFERKFAYYAATHSDLGDGAVRIAKRTLQDFLTKDWSRGTAMESIEMNETHNVFAMAEAITAVEAAGFTNPEWTPFRDIRGDLDRAGGELMDGEPWHRKFLLTATKPEGNST